MCSCWPALQSVRPSCSYTAVGLHSLPSQMLTQASSLLSCCAAVLQVVNTPCADWVTAVPVNSAQAYSLCCLLPCNSVTQATSCAGWLIAHPHARSLFCMPPWTLRLHCCALHCCPAGGNILLCWLADCARACRFPVLHAALDYPPALLPCTAALQAATPPVLGDCNPCEQCASLSLCFCNYRAQAYPLHCLLPCTAALHCCFAGDNISLCWLADHACTSPFTGLLAALHFCPAGGNTSCADWVIAVPANSAQANSLHCLLPCTAVLQAATLIVLIG